MKTQEAKQSEQGQVSAQATESKDVTQNNFTDDEKALAEKCQVSPEAVRQITEIVCKDTKGIQQLIDLVRDRKEQEAEPEQAKTKDPDKSLNEEIARLEPEEKAVLTTFLKGLWVVDTALTPGMVKCYLNITQEIVERQKMTAEKEKAEQEERKKRDSLTGQAKVDYFVEKLRTEDIGVYRASFQREILELIRDDKPIPIEEHCAFRAKTINKRFEGCSKSFQLKVIDQYLTTILPEMEANHQKEDASQDAYDDLLSHLGNKTTAEINALTEQLKRADVA